MCANRGMISHIETYDPVLTNSADNRRIMLDLKSACSHMLRDWLQYTQIFTAH